MCTMRPTWRKLLYLALLVLFSPLAAKAQQASTSVASIEALIRAKDYDQALERTRGALRHAASDYRLWTLQGIALSMTERKSDALNAFDRALHLEPTYRPALQGKVELLYQTLDDRAIPLLADLLKTDPNDATAHEMYAVLKATQGKCSSAMVHFRAVEKAMARHPTSLGAYGYCLARTKETEKAIAVFTQLVTSSPNSTYRYDLAVLLIETKQYAGATNVLEPLLTASEPDPDILSLASEAYEGSGDTPKAVALLRQAIVLSPSTASYYNAFALLCLDHESYQVGIDMINAGMQRISADASLYLSRGLLYAQLAEYDKAEADFRTAETLDSKQTLSSYAMDLSELQKYEPEKAIAQLRSQVKAHPDSARHHYLLAELLDRAITGDRTQAIQEAIASAQMAVKLQADFVRARDLLARLYQDSGQYALAVEQSQLALRYAPSDQSAIYRLILLFRRSGTSEERAKVPGLVQRLSALQQAARQQETDRKRFRLIEE